MKTDEIPLKEIYLLLLKDLRSKQDKDSSYYMALSYAIEAIENESQCVKLEVNNMRYKVITTCKIIYGNKITACIHLNKGQIWEFIAHFSDEPESYSLYRNGVTIDVTPKDFERIFKEC